MRYFLVLLTMFSFSTLAKKYKNACDEFNQNNEWAWSRIDYQYACESVSEFYKSTACVVVGELGINRPFTRINTFDGIGGGSWGYEDYEISGSHENFYVRDIDKTFFMERWDFKYILNFTPVDSGHYELEIESFRKEKGIFKRWSSDGMSLYECVIIRDK